MRESLKVSIIIPCFNVEKYIKKCLETLINQTLKEIEIICIDDGSQDKTLEILNHFSQLDTRIKVFSQENLGVASARNHGLKYANAPYITFVDSDDWIDLNFIEKLYNSITQNNCDVAVATVIRKREHREKYRIHYKEEKIYETLKDKIKICDIPRCCYVWAKLFKKELIQNNPFKDGVNFEDVLWLPETIKKSKKLVTIPNTNYYYRVNLNSIVKKKQSDKKQKDNYNAKKYIVEFFNKNNLNLPKKYTKITKKIKYFFNIPILKIKEEKNKYLKYYLFGFFLFYIKKVKHLHCKNKKKFFYFRDFDGHYFIQLFCLIQMKIKHKTNFPYIEVKEYGLNKEPRDKKIIVSLTSFPARINIVHKTINTLLNQTFKPDKVILWLGGEQFPNKEKDLPESLLSLQNYGLEIGWCEDIRSYKKLIPSLQKYPNDIIVTTDDDIYYPKDWLLGLYEAYQKNPNCICASRICVGFFEGENFKMSSLNIPKEKNIKTSILNQLIGCGGVLYPPNCLMEEILNIENIKTLIPSHDDIYFWGMAVLKGTKTAVVDKKYNTSVHCIENSQDSGLCKINNSNSSNGMLPSVAFQRLFEKYPQILEILKAEANK